MTHILLSYDRYRGVISLINVQEGVLRKGKNNHPRRSCSLNHVLGDKISSCHTRKKYEITELGILHPEEIPTQSLNPGQVGYIACNMKQSSEGNVSDLRKHSAHTSWVAHIGDTLHHAGELVEPMEGFQETKAMVNRLHHCSPTLLNCQLGFCRRFPR